MRKAGGAVHGQGSPSTRSILTASIPLLFCLCLLAASQPVAAKDQAKATLPPPQAPHAIRSAAKSDGPSSVKSDGLSSSKSVGPALSPRAAVTTRKLILRKNDTLIELLTRSGISRGDAFAAMQAVQEVYDLRKLQPGQAVAASTAPDEGDGKPTLQALHLEAGPSRDLTVVRGEDGRFEIDAASGARALSVQHRDLVIETDVQHSLASADVPAAVAAEVTKVAVFDPDFPSKPQAGARL